MSRVAAAALVVAACKPLPPAPMVALHDSTAAAPVDTTTALVVVGLAGEVFGGDGLGVGFRLERQVTARTALGTARDLRPTSCANSPGTASVPCR